MEYVSGAYGMGVGRVGFTASLVVEFDGSAHPADSSIR